MQELSHEEAWEHYSKLLKDLLTVCQLTSIQQWPQLQEFLQSFAKQSPGAVARSAMHVAITGNHTIRVHPNMHIHNILADILLTCKA